MLKFLSCDFGALSTAILAVSALAVVVPAKHDGVSQLLANIQPTSLLCRQGLDARMYPATISERPVFTSAIATFGRAFPQESILSKFKANLSD